MATPVHEQIILKVKQRLQTIDEDAGFETSVTGTVVRPMRILDWASGRLSNHRHARSIGEKRRIESSGESSGGSLGFTVDDLR